MDTYTNMLIVYYVTPILPVVLVSFIRLELVSLYVPTTEFTLK